MGFLALFTFSLWLLWIFYRDGKERASVSSSVWIVVGWLFIHSTRPLSVWLGWESHYSRDEGNPEEALFNFILIVAGLIVVMRRRIQWLELIKDNKWLFVLYLFWFLSILWSDYPFITFKRLFKEVGNIFMVLIVLTDRDPSETIRAVCVRFAYLCIPLSIILIRYYPQWGRTFVGYHRDTLMYTGVTTQKNMLGLLVLVSALFVLWDLLEHRGKNRSATEKLIYTSNVLVLLMCWYLLWLIDSATSLICAVVGSVLFLMFRRPFFRENPVRMEAFGLSAAVILALFDSVFDIRKTFVESLGRNMTLTTRTEIWDIVRDYQDNPLVGQGFETFWAGERLEQLADKTFGIIQAHNGYLETYLNGGLIGVGLLVIVLLSAYKRIRKKLVLGKPEDCIRFTIFLTAMIYNYTEASFFKIGVLWFVIAFAIIEYRVQRSPMQSVMRSALENSVRQPIPLRD
jgi:exopolysaccharide production protein ExoQ